MFHVHLQKLPQKFALKSSKVSFRILFRRIFYRDCIRNSFQWFLSKPSFRFSPRSHPRICSEIALGIPLKILAWMSVKEVNAGSHLENKAFKQRFLQDFSQKVLQYSLWGKLQEFLHEFFMEFMLKYFIRISTGFWLKLFREFFFARSSYRMHPQIGPSMFSENPPWIIIPSEFSLKLII